MCRHRPRALSATSDKENNTPITQKSARLYGGTPQSVDRLVRPFKCPGSATAALGRTSDKPARKRRKISYADADGSTEDGDVAYSNKDRLALATRDVNKFPVFKPRNKDDAFRQKFAVPMVKKATEEYNAFRPAPLLGMRQGATFVARPLHDPTGEFAIVLYDPTIHDKPVVAAKEDGAQNGEDGEKPKLDVPIMHKSLADILGLKKQVGAERKQVPVVIDPRLARVLRPHQVAGVKVGYVPWYSGTDKVWC